MNKEVLLKKYIFFLWLFLPVMAHAGELDANLESVCRPTFIHKNGSSHSAGTAFKVLLKDGRTLLLSANHLFGPNGGLKKTILPKDMPKKITAVHCVGLDDESKVLKAKNALYFRNVTAINAPVRLKDTVDISGFLIPTTDKRPSLTLANTSPKKGDTVYLLAQVRGSSQYIHKAVVDGETGTLMNFIYDSSTMNLNATSGAPIVNSQGEVVGVNWGGYSGDDKLMGISMSLKTIQQVLGISAP
ncbi:MAG: trypsin-like peptidase domain-containing protein [Formosimonas sp.]